MKKSQKHAAIAYDEKTGGWGYSYDHLTEDLAKKAATEKCSTCTVKLTWNQGCGALAQSESKKEIMTTATGATRPAAEGAAKRYNREQAKKAPLLAWAGLTPAVLAGLVAVGLVKACRSRMPHPFHRLAMTAMNPPPTGPSLAQLQAFLNIHVFGMTPQAAVEAPRFASYSWPASAVPRPPRPRRPPTLHRLPTPTRQTG